METTVRDKRQKQYETYKKTLKLSITGGVAFWITNFATSMFSIAAEFRSAFSVSYIPMLVESLIGGLIVGFCVSYSLIRFFDKIPTKNPILKSLILSFVALFIIQILSTFFNLSNASAYILIVTKLNVPRFFVLGIVIGYTYKRLYGSA
ncbi:MAG: hypothetical protein HPY60_06535 [Candidatus Methanofastidiosum sp.]|nr:hypothetical protein [Methanofastidiosum sp.]